MKLFSKEVVYIVRDNMLGSYFLDLGYFLKAAAPGMSLQSSDNFVSVRKFTKSEDMLDFMKQFEQEDFNFSMAIDPLASEQIIQKYFEDFEK